MQVSFLRHRRGDYWGLFESPIVDPSGEGWRWVGPTSWWSGSSFSQKWSAVRFLLVGFWSLLDVPGIRVFLSVFYCRMLVFLGFVARCFLFSYLRCNVHWWEDLFSPPIIIIFFCFQKNIFKTTINKRNKFWIRYQMILRGLRGGLKIFTPARFFEGVN